MKVLYYNEISDEDIGYLRSLVRSDIEVIPPSKMGLAISKAGEYDAVIGARIPKDFLRNAVDLKYFIIPFAGIPKQDRYILDEYPDLTIINSHFNARYVAEHAFALILASAKRLMPIHEKHKKGDWTPRYEHKLSVSIQGKTLLILGYGHIGKEVGIMGKSFGMRVEAIKRSSSEDHDIDFLGTNKDLHSRLAKADFIVITLPLTDETKDYLGEEEFNIIKDNAHIVNVGRGPVIDEKALYEALKAGKLGGVALDTWWVYPPDEDSRGSTMPSKYPLDDFDNVIFSPHRASHVEGREKKRMESIGDILNTLESEDIMDEVDKRWGY